MKTFNKLALIFGSIFLSATILSAEPEIFSPEDFGPSICVGCCDDNGNQLPSDPDCGCEVKDSCGVCGGDNSSCGCELFDCAGNPFPNPLDYCHLDTNRDKLITHEDAQAVIDYLEVNRSNSVEVTEENKRFNTSQTDNFISPLDALKVINFLNSNVPGVTKVDSCNVCGGSGKNVCGTCPNTGDFIEPQGPNGICGCPNATDYSGPFNSECQICTNLGKDSCGRCPGDNEYNTSCATPTPSPSPSPSLTPTPTQTPTPSRTPTPTPSQTPTPIPSPSLTPTPSPTPPPVCEVYTLENLNTSKTFGEEEARWVDRARNNNEWDLFSGEGGSLACLDSLVTDAVAKCKEAANFGADQACNISKGANGFWKNRTQWFGDDINAGKLMEKFFVREDIAPMYEYINRLPDGRDTAISYTLKGKYITKNCEVIDSDVDPALICGSLKIDMISSPISLNWTEKENGVNKISFVDFPIIPNSTGKFFLWKASGDRPLLAIDNNKDGIINDGTELFGNWTFGGKASSSLNPTSNKTAWKNGYEALATLDTDKNGVVEGSELKDIVLWFDYNKNGKSDAGELVKAEDADLSKLFYNPSHSDPINGDLIATKGFEREVNGKNIEGSSVDWYSKSYNSVAEGITSQQLNWLSTTPITNQGTNGNNETSQSKVGSNVPSKGEDIDYSGIWKWQIDGGKTPEGGILVLLQNMEGEIIGESSIIVPVFPAAGKNQDIQGVIARYKIEGQIMKTEKGRDVLEFTTFQDDLKTENSVQLVNGRLVGRSTGQLAKSEKETSTVSYSWTATRIDK